MVLACQYWGIVTHLARTILSAFDRWCLCEYRTISPHNCSIKPRQLPITRCRRFCHCWFLPIPIATIGKAFNFWSLSLLVDKLSLYPLFFVVNPPDIPVLKHLKREVFSVSVADSEYRSLSSKVINLSFFGLRQSSKFFRKVSDINL